MFYLKLRLHVSQAFPLEAAAEAHRCLKAGSVTGKIVLAIQDGLEFG